MRFPQREPCRLTAATDFELLAFSAPAGNKSVQSPRITQEARTIDVVVGSRQVEAGTTTVKVENWIDTTVTEQTGWDEVKVGKWFTSVDTTYTQDAYYNPSNGDIKKYFICWSRFQCEYF